MKTKTETILIVSKYLALTGGIGYSILCGSQLLTFVSSFINPEWSKHTLEADVKLFRIHDQSIWLYISAYCFIIAVLATKALIWYIVFELLSRLKLQTPFSMDVAIKLERIAYLLLGIWIVSSIFWKTYIYYLAKETGIQLAPNNSGDEYLFLAAMIYIISQVFKRGIEIQTENELTI